jgi:uncharacterized RDD family membrane protein YckC
MYTEQSQMSYASLWRRIGASIIDQIALSIANGVLGGILGFSLSMFLLGSGASKSSMMSVINGVSGLIGLISCWAYYAVMESSESRATFGKMLLGIQVSSVDGEQISLARASGRYWAKALFHLLCGIVGIVIGVGLCLILAPSIKNTISGVGIMFLVGILGSALVSVFVQIAGMVAFFMLNPRKQLMHDLMAGTIVTKKPDGLGQNF